MWVCKSDSNAKIFAGAKLRMPKTILKRSAKLLLPDFEPWKIKSSRGNLGNKRRSVGSGLPRKRRRRRRPSSQHSEPRWKKPRKGRDSSSCS